MSHSSHAVTAAATTRLVATPANTRCAGVVAAALRSAVSACFSALEQGLSRCPTGNRLVGPMSGLWTRTKA
jgi:hypothetical protein